MFKSTPEWEVTAQEQASLPKVSSGVGWLLRRPHASKGVACAKSQLCLSEFRAKSVQSWAKLSPGGEETSDIKREGFLLYILNLNLKK